jgi:RNA polymerase-associated protein CTR9
MMLASLRAYARPALSSAETAQEKVKARELFDRVTKALDAPVQANGVSGSHALVRSNLSELVNDPDMFVEIARLWYNDNLEKAIKALKEAVRIQRQVVATASSPSSGLLYLRLQNNLAVLRHLDGSFADARPLYEEALPAALQADSPESEGASTTILYNLARLYEDQGDMVMAKDAYQKLLSRHSEYSDGWYRHSSFQSSYL